LVRIGDPGDLHPLLKIAVESNGLSESNALLGGQFKNESLGTALLNVPECPDASNNIFGISSTPAHPESEINKCNYIYVELDSEIEFFNMLTKDMNNAMELSEQVQREQYQTDISNLEKQITTVVRQTQNILGNIQSVCTDHERSTGFTQEQRHVHLAGNFSAVH
jgi:hypothetical protein